jgi:glycosyltransferase involved in cell wall biosynthesis
MLCGSTRLVEELYNNPALREEMQKQGFRAWQERFTWGRITGAYETLYLGLIGGTA